MQTQHVEMDRIKARALWRDYRKHQHWSQPIDAEVMHAYQALAQGRLVIKAIDSIAQAGLGEDKLPKLAIVPADAKHCFVVGNSRTGACRFSPSERVMMHTPASRRMLDVPPSPGLVGFAENRWQARSIVPQIPLPLRPKRGLANYWILYEAEWSLVPPVDPYLLRRIGQADLWIVCAMWDLTEVERAALAARVRP